MNIRVWTTSAKPVPSSESAAPMISKQRRAWALASGGQLPSGQIGAVPETNMRSPTRTARLKPIVFSNGEPEDTSLRSAISEVSWRATPDDKAIPRRWAARAMASEDGRAEAALSVLRGVSVAQVAEEQGVEPEVVLQWVDLFCEGGEARLSERAPLGPVERDRFLTLVAHEFRTPLAIISGWLDTMLASGPQPEIREEALASIRRQVSHLERVARDALDAGAVARGQLRLIVAPVKLRDLVEGVLSSMRDSRLSLVPGEEVVVVADGSRLEQVVGGVLEHARRLAEDGHVSIEIGTQEGDWALMTASVDGSELDIGDAAALLEPYARSDTSFGTGLGLYLCRALLVAHGGEIGLRAEGKNTMFWFRLPRSGPELNRLVQRS
jgi:signal transduction histidine kinase